MCMIYMLVVIVKSIVYAHKIIFRASCIEGVSQSKVH